MKYMHMEDVSFSKHYEHSYYCKGERFTGLNFQDFQGFQEYREIFSVNISTTLNKHFWLRKREGISVKTSMHGIETVKV